MIRAIRPKTIPMNKVNGLGFQLLIVEDDQFQRELLAKLIHNANNNFAIRYQAEDGQTALKLLSSHSFDAVFTDILMPGLNGLQLLQQLKQRDPELEVILISAYSDFEYARQGIILGAFDYLVKPLDRQKLAAILDRLQNQLEQKSATRQLQNDLLKLFDDNYRVVCSEQDEVFLSFLLKSNLTEGLRFATDIFEQLGRFYRDEPYKIGIILENLIKKLIAEITAKYPWLENRQGFQLKAVNYRFCNDPAVLRAQFKSDLAAIATFETRLHLNHPETIIRQICELVFRHPNGRTTLEATAKQLNFNPDYLGKLFKAKTGESFNDYVTKIKMEQAKSLLRSGKYKNYEIRSILGYKDNDYFCRLFKAYSGRTLTDYRKNFEPVETD